LIQDADIQTLLYDLSLDGGLPPPVVLDGGGAPPQLYAIFLPYSTTVTGQDIGVSCQDFYAYHSEGQVGATPFAYVVIPNCDPANSYGREVSISHELVEAATDPLVNTAPAYANDVYNNGCLGEIADLCTAYYGFYLVGGSVYGVERIWSNSAADGGLQPCIPAPEGPYANMWPDAGPTMMVICADPASPDCTSNYLVHAGQTFDLTVTGWTSEPSVAFGMVTVPYFVGGLAPATFSPPVSQDRYVLQNGEEAHLTVSIPADVQSNTLGIFSIVSGYDNDNFAYWPILVYVQ
jgi:hypothetical protein